MDTTFVLVHGGGGTAWEWRPLIAELAALGHRGVAVTLPAEDPEATWASTAAAVVEQAPERGAGRTVVVGHSLGGFTAPLAARALRADLVVLLCGMVPAPGETVGGWWTATGHDAQELGAPADDDVALYVHDVAPGLAEEALRRGRGQADALMAEPWPQDGWPDVPVRALVGTEDRLFCHPWLQQLTKQRLGIDADEIATGHMPHLARPAELAARLASYATALGAPAQACSQNASS